MIKRNDAYYYKGLLLVLALEATIFYGCYVSMFSLPNPVKDHMHNKNVFSEERAWKHLQYFDSTGYNILGTYSNEVLVPNYIIKELEKLKNNKFNWTVEIDYQKVTGSYYSDFLDSYVNSYSDVTNIIVNVYHSSLLKEYPSSNGIPSVLINAHFDSAIISKGASDDLAAVAIMLELINNIVNTNRIISHKMTFLFNGAEEPFLQGAHGFIYSHPWSKDVRAFINLESIGSGGSSLLFENSDQTSWMIRSYKKVVKHPHVSSFGQDFFDWHIIPAETDYEIFKQYKYQSEVLRKSPLPGVDFAWYKNGYVYHSLIDDINHVEKGQLQYLGESLLPFILEIANSPELDNIIEETDSKGFTSSPLFTDIFRKYLIIIERPMLFFILFILTVVTIKMCYKNMKLYSLFLQIMFKSVLNGLFYFLLFSLFHIYILSHPLSWYSNRWLGVLLYSPPFFYGFIKTLEVEKYKLCKLGYSLRDLEIHSYFGISIFFSIFSLFFASFNSVIFGLLIPCWIFSLSIGSIKEHLKKQVKEVTILTNMIYSLPISILWSEPFYELMCILPPISGRIGERNAFFHEAIIYFPILVSFSLTTALICLPTLIRIENNRNMKIVLILIASIGILFSFILPVHTIETPKRIYPVHLHKWKSIDTTSNINDNINGGVVGGSSGSGIIRSDLIFGIGDGVKNKEIYKLFGFDDNKYKWQKNLRSYINIESDYLQKVMTPFHKMIGGLTIHKIKPHSSFVDNYYPQLNITSNVHFDRNELIKYHDDIMNEKYIRKVEVSVDTIDAGWSIIAIPSKNLYSWSYNKPLPKPVNNQYLIRHDGGLKANNFKFDLYFNSKEKVNIELSTCYTSNHLKKIKGKMGDIIDDILTNEYDYLQISPQVCGTIEITV